MAENSGIMFWSKEAILNRKAQPLPKEKDLDFVNDFRL
jgi:hypothetical protein